MLTENGCWLKPVPGLQNSDSKRVMVHVSINILPLYMQFHFEDLTNQSHINGFSVTVFYSILFERTLEILP